MSPEELADFERYIRALMIRDEFPEVAHAAWAEFLRAFPDAPPDVREYVLARLDQMLHHFADRLPLIVETELLKRGMVTLQ